MEADPKLQRADRNLPNRLGVDCRLPFDAVLSLEGLQLLVFDSGTTIRLFLTSVLVQYGASVITVATKDEAFEVLQQGQLDVLISNVELPDQNSYQLIRQVRSLKPEQGSEIPAIALTTSTAIKDQRRLQRAGFQLQILKPFKSTEIVAAVALLAEQNKTS